MSQITDEQIFAAMKKADELDVLLDDIEAREILAAALSTPPVGAETGEPVAWRYKDWYPENVPYDEKEWHFSSTGPDEDRKECLWEPLFAAPPRSDKANGDWVMVPREPTPEMLLAIAREDWAGKSDLNWSDGWRIMLAAAPLSASPAVREE